MKKKIIAIIVLGILVTTALLIPTETYKKWFGKVPVEKEEEWLYHQVVYLKNKEGYLVGLKVPVLAIEEDQIQQKWDLLTKKVSLIPLGYTSTINLSTELIEYEIQNNKLIFNVSDDFLLSEGRTTIETLAWTFIDDEITEIVILVEGEIINNLGDYHFKKVSKQSGINLKFETMFLYESTPTTLVLHYEDYILPITYFHLETDICEFIIGRIIFPEVNDITVNAYNYVLTSEALVINLLTTSALDTFLITSITDTIQTNLNINSLTINGAENLIHEVIFKTIE